MPVVAVDHSPNVVGNANISAPADNAEEITPSDTDELVSVTRALYVGGAGDIAVVMRDGTDATFKGVLAGTVLPIRIKQVKSTGTTATFLVGLH